MDRVLLSYVGLVSLMSGCASSSSLSTRDAEHTPPPVESVAPEEAREFHIAAADAPTALNEFSRQSNKQVLFDLALLNERRTRGVEGLLQPSDALRSMLKDTGLVPRDIDERTVVISPARSSHSTH
jgi:hypothetical protein